MGRRGREGAGAQMIAAMKTLRSTGLTGKTCTHMCVHTHTHT